jgi:hypothetical protein
VGQLRWTLDFFASQGNIEDVVAQMKGTPIIFETPTQSGSVSMMTFPNPQSTIRNRLTIWVNLENVASVEKFAASGD